MHRTAAIQLHRAAMQDILYEMCLVKGHVFISNGTRLIISSSYILNDQIAVASKRLKKSKIITLYVCSEQQHGHRGALTLRVTH